MESKRGREKGRKGEECGPSWSGKEKMKRWRGREEERKMERWKEREKDGDKERKREGEKGRTMESKREREKGRKREGCGPSWSVLCHHADAGGRARASVYLQQSALLRSLHCRTTNRLFFAA